MSKSVNKVFLIGNLGKDPEVKYLPSGVPVAKFSLATNEHYRNKSGEWQDRTEWHQIVAWNRLAEIVGEYVKRGSKLHIEGRLHTSSWKSGEQTLYRTEIVAEDIILFGGGHDNSTTNGRNGTAHEAHPRDDSAVTQITDEDIPF